MLLSFEVVTLCYGVLLLFLSLSSTSANRNRRTVSDPISSFMSDLGDLFLDVDQTVHVQTAPKVQSQDQLLAQFFRPTNEYLNRIQDNYRTMQNRLGKMIENTLRPRNGYTGRGLSAAPPIADVKEYRSASTMAPTDIAEKEGPSEDECTGEPLSNPFHEQDRKQRCSQKRRETEDEIRKALEKLMQDTRRATEILLPLSQRALNQLSNDIMKRQGEIESEDSKPEGRIIGDALFSESLYDRSLRQFLKTHGRWILDNPLLNRFRQSSESDTESSSVAETETSHSESTDSTTRTSISDEMEENEVTETYVPITSTEYRELLSKSGQSFEDGPLPPQSANYYKVVDDNGEVLQEVVDVVLEQDTDYDDDDEVGNVENDVQDDTVVLAFTPDGVPLKLRMGPEIDNPIRYLHKELKSAGVSLNVPVESYEDLEPVGKEVLKLGSGILTRALYIDVSNENELKSLLKTLRKTKPTKRIKY